MGEVDDYLAGLDVETAAVVGGIYAQAREIVPEAEQGKGYGMPGAAAHRRGKAPAERHGRRRATSRCSRSAPRSSPRSRPSSRATTCPRGRSRFSADRPIPGSWSSGGSSAPFDAGGPRSTADHESRRPRDVDRTRAVRLAASERCPSGLRSATGNRVRGESCVAGSNPALSVRKGPRRALFSLDGPAAQTARFRHLASCFAGPSPSLPLPFPLPAVVALGAAIRAGVDAIDRGRAKRVGLQLRHLRDALAERVAPCCGSSRRQCGTRSGPSRRGAACTPGRRSCPCRSVAAGRA